MNAQAISSATRFPILDRHKKYEFAVSRFDDFSLGDGDDFDVRQTLVDSRLSLYTLDLERKAACFVELPRGVDLATEPFYLPANWLATTVGLYSFNLLVAADPRWSAGYSKASRPYTVFPNPTYSRTLLPGADRVRQPTAIFVRLPRAASSFASDLLVIPATVSISR